MNFNLPDKPVFRLIWPDDSYVSIGDKFGEYRHVVDSIIPVERPGGLGPALWFEVHNQVEGCLGEVNAAYLSVVTYAKRASELAI